MTTLEITLIALLTIILIVSVYCIISYETEIKSLRLLIFEKDKNSIKKDETLNQFFNDYFKNILLITNLSEHSPEQLDDKTEKRLKSIKKEIENLQKSKKKTKNEVADFLTILTNN